MKEVKIGDTYQVTETVTPEMSAANVGSGLLDVYATPSMIALMEKASSELLQKYLEGPETSVGGLVDIRHLKPTAIGDTVSCETTIVESKGIKVVFEVEASDSKGPIGTGKHVRFVVNKDDFMKNV